jgi:3-dehydroquinate dehydratase-2
VSRNRIAVLHGVNLGALDRRPAHHYGDLTFTQLERRIEGYAHALGLIAIGFQTDHEGDYVAELHRAPDYADALILNPGAWTHYSWALRDALEIAALPAAEVHLSAVDQREAFRQVSVFEGVVVAQVSGLGVEGYRVALERLKEELA